MFSHDEESKRQLFKRWIGIGLYLLSFACIMSDVYLPESPHTLNYNYHKGVTEHIEKAVQASTIEIAKNELNLAIDYVNNDSRLAAIVNGKLKGDYSKFIFQYQNLQSLAENLRWVDSQSSLAVKTYSFDRINHALVVTNEAGRKVISPESSDPNSIGLPGIVGLCLLIGIVFDQTFGLNRLFESIFPSVEETK